MASPALLVGSSGLVGSALTPVLAKRWPLLLHWHSRPPQFSFPSVQADLAKEADLVRVARFAMGWAPLSALVAVMPGVRDERDAVRVGLDGVLRLVFRLIPFFEEGAELVVISDAWRLVGRASRPFSMATSGGLASAVRSLSYRWGEERICVWGVELSWVAGTRQRMARSRIPLMALGRPAYPGELAAAFSALLTLPKHLKHGLVFPVDGGLAAGFTIGAR